MNLFLTYSLHIFLYRCAMIKLIAGNNVYLYIVSSEQISPESEKENYLRCHTPSNAVSISPATSPQSVTSSRSVYISMYVIISLQ